MIKSDSLSGSRHYCLQQRDKLLAAGYRCDRLKRLAKGQDFYILTFHWEVNIDATSLPLQTEPYRKETKTMNLSTTNSTSLQSPQSDILGFLEWLSSRPSGEYMSLFANSGGNACEKEVLMYQTIRAMVCNYKEVGELSSKVALCKDSSLAKNSAAFKWLVENNFFVVDGDRCTITDKAIAKLYLHFADQLQALPIAISPSL